MRYERKYRIESIAVPAIRQLLRMHPASFRTLYPDRQVNNIYFDTPSLSTFRQNAAGGGDRKKFRVRWYGPDLWDTRNARLEIKSKQNELGTKQAQPLLSFELDHLDELTARVRDLTAAQQLNLLRPALLNSYGRSYLISLDGHCRITLDYDLRYHSLIRVPHFRRYHIRDAAVILEIKYEAGDDADMGRITQHLPFRQSKHSKYVNGMQMTL